MISLKGQIAVVTGAGSGIGRAIACGFGDQGVDVCLVGRRLNALAETAAAVQKSGVRVQCCPSDLCNDEDIRGLAEFIRTKFEKVDLLVHCAGLISLSPLECAAVADFDAQYRTNVRAPFLLTQTLLPFLKAQQGQIVFINSTAGLSAGPNHGFYAATKHALKALADSLRQEMNKDQVRVLSVYPGRTATLMQEAVFKMEGREYRPEGLIQPEDISSLVINALCLSRNIEVTDIQARPHFKV